jgi:hypothetical protein
MPGEDGRGDYEAGGEAEPERLELERAYFEIGLQPEARLAGRYR